MRSEKSILVLCLHQNLFVTTLNMDLYYGSYPEVDGVFIKQEVMEPDEIGVEYHDSEGVFVKQEELEADEIDIEYHEPEDTCPDVSIQDLLHDNVQPQGHVVSKAASKYSRRVAKKASLQARHQCRLCERNYKFRYHLLRHVRLEHLGHSVNFSLLRCEHCSFFTKHRSSLIKHLTRLHSGTSPLQTVLKPPHVVLIPYDGPPLLFACNKCHKSYDYEFALERHLRLECGQSNVASYKCFEEGRAKSPLEDVVCPSAFIKVEPTLATADLSPSHAKLYGLETECIAPSPRRTSPVAMRHTYSIHHCPTCDARVKQKRTLMLHVKYGCGGKRFKQCSHCDYCTDKTLRMEIHLKTHHAALCYPDSPTPSRPSYLKCPACNRRRSSEAAVVKHMQTTCMALQRFYCTQCPYVGNRKQNLTSHITNNHPKTPKSTVLGVPDTSRPFQCDVCLRTYKHRGDVNRHARVCGTNPQYPCGGCGRTYRHQYALDRHRAIECGKQPQWSCDECPFKTKRSFSLKMHVKNKHSKNRAAKCESDG